MPKLIHEENEEDVKSTSVNEIKVENVKKEDDIPSCYIEIKLPSCGRIEDYPKVLHFRDYTSSDVVDLNIKDDGDIKTLSKVLSRMNYENYDVSNLTPEDLLYITYVLHLNFVSPTIEKRDYIDDTLPEGTEEGCLDYKGNIEIFEIPIKSLKYRMLGYDDDGNKLDIKFKSPFTITDTRTKDKIGVRLPIIKDVQIAMNYVKEKYADEIIKYEDIRTEIERLHNLKENQDSESDKFYQNNKAKVEEYYDFYKEFVATTTKVASSLKIVSYNGKKIDDVDEKLRLYNEVISDGVWTMFDEVKSKFEFGILSEQEVYSDISHKKITKTFQFQLDDFLPSNDRKDTDRFTMSFD